MSTLLPIFGIWLTVKKERTMTILILMLSIMLMVVPMPVHAQTNQEQEREFCDRIGEIGEMLVQYREAGIDVYGALKQTEINNSSPLKEWLEGKIRWVYRDSTKPTKERANTEFALQCAKELLPIKRLPQKLLNANVLYQKIIEYPFNSSLTEYLYCK